MIVLFISELEIPGYTWHDWKQRNLSGFNADFLCRFIQLRCEVDEIWVLSAINIIDAEAPFAFEFLLWLR
ncbi:MAG: hypothetical protein ACI85F_000820, partial [Bacteroidia bacterium]